MFCPECGLEIPDNANFCSYCGKTIDQSIKSEAQSFQPSRLPPVSQSYQPSQPSIPNREDPSPSRPSWSEPPKKSTSGQIAIAGLVVLIIGGVLIYFGAKTLYSTSGITMLAIGVIMILCLLGAVTRGQACLCLACADCGDCDCDC